MTSEQHLHPNNASSNSVDEWDLARDVNSASETQIGLANDAQAAEYFKKNGDDTVEKAFALANILHTNQKVKEASFFYRRAYDLHPKTPSYYPLAQSLLQARLLCLLKAGENAPEPELDELSHLNLAFANYIRGTQAAWRGTPPQAALTTIGNAYDEFHTGEEIDSVYLEIAKRAVPSLFSSATPAAQDLPPIPKKIFFYWDQNPPEEIVQNFEYHKGFKEHEVTIFDKHSGAQWLYENYGIEARTLFINARHPAEAADFLRVHVIHQLGGWWIDADIRLRDERALTHMTQANPGAVFFLTHNGVVHNDFFGAAPYSPVLADCLLSLYRNFYLHPGLFIAYKSGPGIFNRALNRTAYRSLRGQAPQRDIVIYDHVGFSNLIEEFDTPYKFRLPSWYTA